MLSLPRKESLPKGITATTTRTGTTRTMGAMLNTGRSASSGTVSSLTISLTVSAMGCSIPKGPHRLGPSLDWKRPMARLSNQVFNAIAITRALITKKASESPAKP